MSDLQSKTDEELNVMLCELLGWTFRPCTGKQKATRLGWLVSADFRQSVTLWKDGSTGGDQLPRYCTDLNEVAKVEVGLTDEQYWKYRDKLHEITKPESELGMFAKAFLHERNYVSSTARQRTIALIQTLTP